MSRIFIILIKTSIPRRNWELRKGTKFRRLACKIRLKLKILSRTALRILARFGELTKVSFWRAKMSRNFYSTAANRSKILENLFHSVLRAATTQMALLSDWPASQTH